MYGTIVLGLGGMGSAAAYHLARAGERVLGLEQFEAAHARGSSHGYTRMLRTCYFEHPDYVPLVLRASELWHELGRELGETVFHVTGGVFMGAPGSEVVEGSARAARLHGLAHEVLGQDELARRFPQFVLPGGWSGVYEPNAGFVLAERAVLGHLELARRQGAELRFGERALSWSSDGRGVEVRTGSGVYRAERLVIAAGAWAERVVGHPQVRVAATRQVLGWVTPRRNGGAFEVGRMPVWAIDSPGGDFYYGFPVKPGAEGWGGGPGGFKIARHVAGAAIDPDSADRSARAEDEAEFRAGLRRYIPDGDGELVALRVCIYENSPDGHFMIDRHPEHPNIVVAAGFSGHGFKFASAVGEVVAGMALGRGGLEVGFLGLGRFLEGGEGVGRGLGG